MRFAAKEGIFMSKKMDEAKKAMNSVAVGRVILIALAFLLQIAIIVLAVWALGQNFVYYYAAMSVIGLIVALAILNGRSNPAYKMAWILVVLILPVLGVIIYLVLGSGFTSNRVKKMLVRGDKKLKDGLGMERNNVIDEIFEIDPHIGAQMKYLKNVIDCPAYKGTNVEFLTPGEVKFDRLKAELKKAEEFIFIEYFIIGEGVMWGEILEILIEKVKQGVEVRVMYDDFGSLVTVPAHYERTLKEYGIKACVFNKVTPLMSAIINHRDHRKIVVIDGKVGFTGGINLADEYINEYEKHGHWKDSAIVIDGEAVWSLTCMFLSTWEYINNINEDFEKYRVMPKDYPVEGNGAIQPYYDSPLDGEQAGENVYLNMISRAERYIYIESPYLVIDNEMLTALCNSAKQGVDVRIITPHIGDHWYVHAMTRSNYQRLIECGVRVYEYTPGFIHSKVFVCDDKVATVGTVNMDYRSLYLHFECGALLYDMPAIVDICNDFMEITKVSHEVTLEECKAAPLKTRLVRSLLKVFAPMM